MRKWRMTGSYKERLKREQRVNTMKKTADLFQFPFPFVPKRLWQLHSALIS